MMAAGNGIALSPGEVHIYRIDVGGEAEHLDRYVRLLSGPERERAGSYRFAADRRRFIVTRGRLRSVLSRYLPAGPGEIEFGENEYGKPSVPGGIEFSLSGSAGRGLIGVARRGIGVDLERVDPGKITPEMAGEIFTDSEREYLAGTGMPEDPGLFFRAWARKESIVKAWGTGLSLPAGRVESRPGQKSFITDFAGAEWFTRDLDPGDPAYRAAVTVLYRGKVPGIKTFDV